jgi:hypothetical protein
MAERADGCSGVLAPQIDWTKFDRGAISEKMWSSFKALVQLCHAFQHWQKAAHDERLPGPPRPFGPETKYQSKKRGDAWKRDIERLEGHRNRAGFLAAQTIAEMSYMIGLADKGTPDWILWWALRTTADYRPYRENEGHYKALTFVAFNASDELQAADPQQIAARWLKGAGDEPRL